MRNHIQPTHDRKADHTPARRRSQGSLLVLVVVCLVLMALLGAAYLQVARVDRFATADQAQNNIDQVANATIAYIAKVLQNDIVDNNDGFFAAASATPYDDGTGNEGYDYPWTNNAGYANTWAVTFDPNAVVPTTDNADGGIYDDTWLSSTFPTFYASDTRARWDHITNLMGTFLQLPSTTGNQQPTELATKAADATHPWRNDTNVPISNTPPFADGSDSLADSTTAAFLPLGIDTDLDGIPDAKWQWAPLRQIGSVKYVMAVRIIDNASLININTATAMTSDGINVTDARGYTPSEIDLSRLLHRVNGTVWQNELVSNASPDSLFRRRGIDASILPTPLGTIPIDTAGRIDWSSIATTTRIGSWFNNAQMWSDPTNKLARSNEIELRRFNGVNNVHVTAAIEDAMPALLRAAQTETGYNDPAIYSGLAGITDDERRRLAFFQGSTNADRSDPDSLVSSRDFPSLRNQITTHSAAALFASNAGQVHQRSAAIGTTAIPATPPPARVLKYDLVNAHGGNINENPVRVRAIRDRLFRIFRISSSGGANAYLGFSNNPAGAAELSDIATEYALAIHAYSTPGSTPASSQLVTTPVPPNTATPAYATSVPGRIYYSLETLPFFREVYAQAAYLNQDNFLADGVTVGNDGLVDTLAYQPDTVALAFEVANPFDRPIDFASADGPSVQAVVKANNVMVATYPITHTINPRDAHIYHASRTTNLHPEGNDGLAHGNLETDLSLGAYTHHALPEIASIPANAQITLELQVEVPKGSGTWVTYDRMSDTVTSSMMFPATRPVSPQNPDASYLTTHQYHYEFFALTRPSSSAATNDHHIGYISNRGRTATGVIVVSGNNTFPGISRLGQNDKLIYGAEADLARSQLPMPNRQLVSVAELGWIFAFGFYTNPSNPADDAIGDFPTRVENLPAVRRHLQFDFHPVPDHGTMRMSHGALVLEQFTTLSPRSDGLDNDGDGVNDNDAEQVVHGQININTAPLHLLTLAAPLNEGINDIESLMKRIVEYRDNPTARAGFSTAGMITRPGLPGVASIGELMGINNPSLPANERINGYSNPLGASVDLYPMPEEAVAPVVPVTDLDPASPEVQLARFQFLSQAFNTRSDVYTAFIRLRGYPAQDFSKGEVESLNFLVVFDRSNIVNPGDMPRVLGVYFYNVP